MNQDIASAAQQRAKLITSHVPLPLEPFVWSRHIDDRQVEPQHLSAKHFLTKVFHPKDDQLLRLNQGNYGGCSPIADGIEIERKITIPMPAHGMLVIFAGAEGNPNPSEGGPPGYGCDLQRMG